MTSSAMVDADHRVPARRARRLLWFLSGLVVVGLTAALAGRVTTDLTVVLLVVLVEVLVVAMLSGPLLAVVAASCAVVLVNWFDVPPYHTFRIASAENVVALVVFGLVAVVAAVLVDLSGRARANAARAEEKATLLADVVSLQADADTATALVRIREALELDRVVLTQVGAEGRVLREVGVSAPMQPPSVDVSLDGGYRLVGYGPDRVGAERSFLVSIAEAAVRAYEGERLAEEQRRADELAVIDRTRSALLASVGHDLRTPLAGLRVAVDALAGPQPLSPGDRLELLSSVQDSTARLDELITNLLDMSRLEAGSLIARVEPTAVDEVVGRALLGIGAAEVVTDVPDSLPLVDTDPALLERVLANLVTNALRHSRSAVPVEVLAHVGDESVDLVVVDHGVGLGPHVGSAWPAPGADRADGSSGLGLAIVRGFTSAIGAQVGWTETQGGGVTVTVGLPASRERLS